MHALTIWECLHLRFQCSDFSAILEPTNLYCWPTEHDARQSSTCSKTQPINYCIQINRIRWPNHSEVLPQAAKTSRRKHPPCGVKRFFRFIFRYNSCPDVYLYVCKVWNKGWFIIMLTYQYSIQGDDTRHLQLIWWRCSNFFHSAVSALVYWSQKTRTVIPTIPARKRIAWIHTIGTKYVKVRLTQIWFFFYVICIVGLLRR